MTIRSSPPTAAFRQRYWARNHVGWRHMDETLPNAGHRALAALERAGVVTGVITQNVDLLHTKAGSRTVINLHGTYAQVVCLDCGHTMTRAALADQLEALNPGFLERAEAVGGIAVAPDADAMVAETASFRSSTARAAAGCSSPTSCTSARMCQRACRASIFACRRRGCTAGGRLVADGVLRATGSSGTPSRGHPGRDHQPRPHPRRRPGDRQDRRRLLDVLALLADELPTVANSA